MVLNTTLFKTKVQIWQGLSHFYSKTLILVKQLHFLLEYLKQWGVSRVSGLDKPDVIGMLAFTAKIQVIGNLNKMSVFSLLAITRDCTASRGSIRPRWVTYQWWTFWFRDCIFQNSLQNAAMLMVLLLLALHPNRAKAIPKNLVAACKGSHLELRQNSKETNILF